MSAHTPGPWKTVFANNCARVERDTAAMDRHIATVYGPDAADAFSHADLLTANARVIAAAPDLAQALKDTLKVIDALMPGARYLALQDYKILNDAPLAAHAALRKAGL